MRLDFGIKRLDFDIFYAKNDEANINLSSFEWRTKSNLEIGIGFDFPGKPAH